ncbi:MAG: FAD:protein FMN transferase, partial [Solirubrobacterales bacterium]|nr:FAD:protein FMN transferase [Solirubrobacterales bacterium]
MSAAAAKEGAAPATVEATWETWSTTVVVRVTQPRALTQAREILTRELAAIELACSRFRTDSDLARVNDARGRWVAVDGLLIDALRVALRAARLTDGDVDPTVGWALELAGYDRDWRLLASAPSGLPGGGGAAAGGAAARGAAASSAAAPGRERGAALDLRARARGGWRAIEIDAARGRVRVPAAVRLDLGATAKAWAADRGARAVYEATGCGVLVAIGGDIATAGTAPARGWAVRVTDDHRAGASAPGQTIAIRGGGLATSSITARRWLSEGEAMHHIIDPRTGRPAGGRWRTVSVAAVDCVDANIATTATIAGRARSPEWLDAQGLPARL